MKAEPALLISSRAFRRLDELVQGNVPSRVPVLVLNLRAGRVDANGVRMNDLNFPHFSIGYDDRDLFEESKYQLINLAGIEIYASPCTVRGLEGKMLDYRPTATGLGLRKVLLAVEPDATLLWRERAGQKLSLKVARLKNFIVELLTAKIFFHIRLRSRKMNLPPRGQTPPGPGP